MSDADYEWRRRLQPVNLVIETDFTAEEVREAQRNFGTAARQLLNKGAAPKQIIKRYPALTLMILVGHASIAYVEGAYWDSFWQELGMGRDPDFENEIRQSFNDLLDKFSLARFAEIESASSYKFVMMFALHAGIPVNCLKDLLALINSHIVQGRHANGAAVLDWLLEPGKGHRTSVLDKPVRNFLEFGAEFAVDILDRIIEFITASDADPGLLDSKLDPSTTGLPGVLLEELQKQLREAPSRGPAKPQGGRHAIRYSVDDDEVLLALPAPVTLSELPWRVSFDGDVREVHAMRRWGDGTQAALARVAVPGPIREVIISHPAHAAVSVPLVVQSDPLLTFDRSGKQVPRHVGLKDCAWVVFPDDHDLIDSGTQSPVAYRDTGAPAGWNGWRSAFVELTAVEAVQLRRGDDLVGTPRRVLKSQQPYFEFGPKVPGVATVEGQSVYGTRPWVILPARRSTPPPKWNVRVRRLGDSEWLVNESWFGGDAETCVDPFDDAEDPQLGVFEVLVTGPMGSDARCVFFLAEGLETAFRPAIRVPVENGFTPCVASVAGGRLSLTPDDEIAFGPKDLEVTLAASNGQAAVELLLRPPHLEMRSGEVGVPVVWRMTPAICDPEDFAQDRFVAVRAPGISNVDFGYFSARGDLIQKDPNPRRRQGDLFESKTQQFADTVRAHPKGSIVATLQTENGPVQVTVLSAQPRRLASDVKLVDDRLVFVDAASVDDLAVYVWNNTAPWRPAEVLPVREGAATLPEHLIGKGELRCELFVDDPWVFIDKPLVPSADAFHVEQAGWCEEGTHEQKELSRYLGSQGISQCETGVIPEVWVALARLHAEGNVHRLAGLIDVLVSEPRKALECLGDSTIPAGDKMAMLIRSEIVNRKFQVAETLNELHPHPWFGCMVEIADLPSLYNRRTEVRAEREETLAYLRDRGGLPLTELLRTGQTSAFKRSCFDSSVLEMSFRPGNPLEAKLHEIQQLPHPALHPENLLAGVYEALLQRSEWMESGWSMNFSQQVGFMLKPIRRASLKAHDMIALREVMVKNVDPENYPWMFMSVQSLTLAFAARLEAYGRLEGRYLNRGLLGDWARLAQLCPTMVANDLLIAEAVVLYDRRGDLIGDD